MNCCGDHLTLPVDQGRFRCEHCGIIRDSNGKIERAAKKKPGCRPIHRFLRISPVTWKYSKQHLERISWGFVPSGSLDKWSIYQEEAHVYFHRSATGQFCYRVKIEGDAIVEVAVSKHLCKAQSEEQSLAAVSRLIGSHLLGIIDCVQCGKPIGASAQSQCANCKVRIHDRCVGSSSACPKCRGILRPGRWQWGQ
jgi:hypothetical protein